MLICLAYLLYFSAFCTGLKATYLRSCFQPIDTKYTGSMLGVPSINPAVEMVSERGDNSIQCYQLYGSALSVTQLLSARDSCIPYSE